MEGKRAADYSYNWPYDFFSLVETVKLNLSVSLRNRRLIEDVEVQELNERVTLEPIVSSIASSSGGGSLGSISESAVRGARRMASTESLAAATSATFGTSTRTTTPGGLGSPGGGTDTSGIGTPAGGGGLPTTRGSY